MEESKPEILLLQQSDERVMVAEKLEPVSPPNSSPLVPSVMFRGKYEKPKCAVCHEDGDGLHFGAEACRACTAFFRRSVALGKKYECRAGGNCEVASNIRCMCRACRFNKCLEVGMNPDCVQNRRDITGGREEAKVDVLISHPTPPSQPIIAPIPISQNTSLLDFSIFKTEPSTSSFSPFSIPSLIITPSLETMPLLERMRVNYEKMENARAVIHRREGESIFQQKVPKSITFREAAEITTREVALVADWVEWCFDDFSVLPSDQKTVLFQNFFIYFSMLERSFMTYKNGSENLMVLASKDYIDYANLEHFFKDCGNADKACTPLELANLIKPSFDLQKSSLINLMKIECMDQYEFFAICVMLFWDFGLEGQSDDCNEVGRKVKQQVTREMAFYLRRVKKYDEPLFRMSSVASILPALQKIKCGVDKMLNAPSTLTPISPPNFRAVRRFQQDIEMAHFFNIYALPANFYNIVNGKFS